MELLKTWIHYNRGNVKQALIPFVKPNLLDAFDHKVSTDLYLNDFVLTIHKSTLETHQGIIVYLGSRVCICKRGNKSCVYVDPSDVYFFIKRSKQRNNDRIFYEQLLKIM